MTYSLMILTTIQIICNVIFKAITSKTARIFDITSMINKRTDLTCKSFYAPQAFFIYIVKQMSGCIVLDSSVTLLWWTCFSLGKTPEENNVRSKMSNLRGDSACLCNNQTKPHKAIRILC